MKKIIITLILTLTLCSTLTGCADKVKSLLKKDTQTEENIGVHYVDDKYYTRNETIWKQMKPEDEITYTSNYDKTSKVEFLTINIMDKRYVRVELPGYREYINTGSVIKSTDGAIKINIYPDKVGSDIELTNEVLYDKNTKFSDDGGDFVHTIVKDMINGYTIVAHVGSNSEDWSFIRDMVINIQEDDVIKSDNKEFIMSLPAYDDEILQSVFVTDDYVQVPTLFNDGYICTTISAFDFDKNVDCVYTWLSNVSDGTKITLYKNKPNNIYYGETETGYSCAIFKDNEQYMYIVYGFGNEACTNILRMLKDE